MKLRRSESRWLIKASRVANLVADPKGGRRCQHLERDLAAESGVDGAPHLAHAARAQRGGDLVRADLSEDVAGGSELAGAELATTS